MSEISKSIIILMFIIMTALTTFCCGAIYARAEMIKQISEQVIEKYEVIISE